MRKDSKDLVVHVCGKRGSRHSGGCVGCLKVLSEYTDPMASEEEDCEVGSVRYCRDVLKLNNEGYDPRAKEIDRMVPKEEVLRVFGSKTGGKRNLRIENCVDSHGNPDHEFIDFATELHKKVYRTCKSKDISLAFGRGVLADRRGARIDWATFASKTQAKQMKMAASWAERHPGEVVSGRDVSGKDASGNAGREESKGHREEEVSSCDKELIAPAVCDVVSMDVERVPAVEEQINWQQHPATSDTERMMEDGREDADKPQVADDDIWENNRVEEIEEQLKRVDMQRKQWQEEYIKVLQSSLQSLQSDRAVAEREMQDVTVKLKEGRGKIVEVQKRILTVKENLEQNKLERTKHEDRLQSLVWDKRRLSRPSSKPPNLSELNAERELVQELLQGTYEQAGILEQLMARHGQMEAILRQRVAELDAHLADVVKNFQEKDSRVEKESKKLQEAFQVMLHFQSVYNLIKQSDNLVIVPRCIPQPREYPQELNPPQTITIKPCPVCSRWFYCGDWVGASCGCVYHLHCAAMWFRQSNKCCKPGCSKNMHPDWLTAWGKQWDDEALLTNLEKNLDEWRNRWKDDYKRQGRKRSRNDAFSSFDLSLEIGGGFEGARLGLNTIDEPGLHDLDPKRIRASEDSSVTCNQCMQDFVIEDVPGEPCHEAFEQEDQDNPVKHGDLTLNLLETLEEVGPVTGHVPERIDGLEHGREMQVSSQDASEQDGEGHNGLRETNAAQQSSEKQGQNEDVHAQSIQDLAGRNGESSAATSEEALEISSPKQVTSEEGRGIQRDVKDMPVTTEPVDEDVQIGHAVNKGMDNSEVQDASDMVNESRHQTVQRVEGGKTLSSQTAAVKDTEHLSSVKELISTTQSADMDSDVGDVDDTDVHDFIVDDVRKLVGESECEAFDDRKSAPSHQNRFEEEAELQNGVTVNRQQSVEREGKLEYVENARTLHFVDDGSALVGEVGPKVSKPGEQGSAPTDTIAGDGNRELQHAVKQVVATQQSQGGSEVRDAGDAIMQDAVDDVVMESVSEPRHQSLRLEDQNNAVAGQGLLESENGLHIGSKQVAGTQLIVERESKVGDCDDGEPSIGAHSELKNVCDTAMQDVVLENQALGLEVPSIPASVSDNELQSAAKQMGEPQQRLERESLGEDADHEMLSMQTESQVKDDANIAMPDLVVENQELVREVQNIPFLLSEKELQSAAEQMGEPQQRIERESLGESAGNEMPCIQTESQVKYGFDTAMQNLVVENQALGLEVPSIPASVSDKDLQSAAKQMGEPQQLLERESAGENADHEMLFTQTESQVKDDANTDMQDLVVGNQQLGLEVQNISILLPDKELQSAAQQMGEPQQRIERASSVESAGNEMPSGQTEIQVEDGFDTGMQGLVVENQALGLEVSNILASVSDKELQSAAKQMGEPQQRIERESSTEDADHEMLCIQTESQVKDDAKTAMQDLVVENQELGLEVQNIAILLPYKELHSAAEQMGEPQQRIERESLVESAGNEMPFIQTESQVEDGFDTAMQGLVVENQALGLEVPCILASGSDKELQSAAKLMGEPQQPRGSLGDADNEVPFIQTESQVEDVTDTAMQDLVVGNQALGLEVPSTSGAVLGKGFQCAAKQVGEPQRSIDRQRLGEDADNEMPCVQTESQVADLTDTALQDFVADDGSDFVTESKHQEFEDQEDAAPAVVLAVRDAELHTVPEQVTDIRQSVERENKVGGADGGGQISEIESRVRSSVDTAMQDFVAHDIPDFVDDLSHKEMELDDVGNTATNQGSDDELQSGAEQLARSGSSVERNNTVEEGVISVANDAVNVTFDAGENCGEAEVDHNEMCPVEHVFDAGDNSMAPHSPIPALVTAEERADDIAVDENPPIDAGGRSGEAEVDAGDNSVVPHLSMPAVVTAEGRVDNVPEDENQRIDAGGHSEAEVVATEPCSPRNFGRMDNVPVVEVATGHRARTGFTPAPGAVIELLSDDDDDDVIEIAAPTQFVSRRNRLPERAVQQSTSSEAGVRTAAQPGMFTALLRAMEQNPLHR